MKLYIVKDFDDNIIGELPDYADAVKLFRDYKPDFDVGYIEPFIYEVEIRFTECPISEYDGILKNRALTLYKRLLKQLYILQTWNDVQLNGQIILDTFEIPGVNSNRLPNYDMNNIIPKPSRYSGDRSGYIRFNPIPSSMKNR